MEGEITDEQKKQVKQEQIHDILFSRELGWQEIIYDLIHTEQLDPWDIDIVILTNKYLEKIQAMEEADFFVSSKVLLAASLLLRIKSDVLLNSYLKDIDDILFGRKDEKKRVLERMELDEIVPELIPKSPMPRFKKVTLNELMESLNKAITTENRRIKKVILNKNALRESSISLPTKKLSIKDKMKDVFEKINTHFSAKITEKKLPYSKLVGLEKEERIACFYPILQLENNNKLWLDQPEHFEDIHIWLKKVFLKHHGNPYEGLNAEFEKEMAQLEKEGKIEELEGELQED